MPAFKEIKESFVHLFFPHVCVGCGSDLISDHSMLCMKCISRMPGTNFHFHSDNPVEKIFWGRLPLEAATAQYYYTKDSLMQRLMNQFKYKGNKELGRQLGTLIGHDLRKSNRFGSIDALVPLPLFPAKEKRRGYNQATLLCEGISGMINTELLTDVIVRTHHTDTQTRKGRLDRWQNMEGKFELVAPEKVSNKHILLVDDVITTGATLEACGRALGKAPGLRLSVATLCFASR